MNLLIAALIAAGIFSFAGDKSVNLEEREAQVAASSHNMYHQDLNEASPLEQYLAGDVSRSGDPMTAFGGPGREITVFNHDPLMAFGGPGEEVSSEWAFAAAREATNFQEKDGVIVLKEVSSEWAFALADDAKNFQEKNGVIVAKVVDKDFRDYALRQSPASPLDRAIEQHFATVVTVPASDSALDRAIEQHFAGIASFEGVASPVASSPASPLEQYLAGDVSRSGDKDYRDYALRDGSRPEAPVVLASSATGAMGGILNYSNNSLLADNGKEIIHVP
jgi:hypothetical protein